MMKEIKLSRVILLFAVLWAVTTGHESQAQIGNRFPSEMSTYSDPVTGIPVKVLTNHPEYSDSRIYQTHPQWTYDNQYIAFRSQRTGSGQLFFVHETTGEIIQITDGERNGEYNLSRKKGLLYFVRRPEGKPAQIIELDFDRVLADSEKGKMKKYTEYERLVTEWPDTLRISGGMGLDVEEDLLYVGVTPPYDAETWVNPIDDSSHRIKNHPGGIRIVDVKTGEIRKAFDVDFTMGHVQASPFVTHEIVFCHETGGDSPQRMWFGDMKTMTYRPLYIESDYEWVTHETIADADHVYFNVLCHLERLKTKPSGIFSVNLRNGHVRVMGQVVSDNVNDDLKNIPAQANSFWHCNGSQDGQWAVGDDFSGNITLINTRTGQMHLLTTGHLMKPDHAHPYFSLDNKRVLIQSGKFSEGKRLAIMVVNIPES
ncbi:oligogalacturonate lyase family protein, partial [Parabacteroides sp. OttesenSCG-928-O15]|nr:oligogalacturonate lyase family protein [Parabacteroides sp. OttesenSCG-928-O15]